MDLSRQDLLLTTLTGAWAREFEPDTAPVRQGRTVFGSVSGTSGHYCNPFFALSDPNTGEHSGEIYGFNLIYSGSYAASVEADSYGSLRIMAGVQSEGFHWTLVPGESFLTPEAVLTSSITGTLQFQSTSSVWRTTFHNVAAVFLYINFNPRPPCGGRHQRHRGRREAADFNPRPPCGGRPSQSDTIARTQRFQSTSSVWRTTSCSASPSMVESYFNPRPPCGGRRTSGQKNTAAGGFQSTSSVWRTTTGTTYRVTSDPISIHVLRVEDDTHSSAIVALSVISIHVLRVEDDRFDLGTSLTKPVFQSTSSVWRTTL